MNSPIGFREFNADEYRKFVQTLSDAELIKAGKRLRLLSGDGKGRQYNPLKVDLLRQPG